MSPRQSAADRTEVGPLQASTLGPLQMSTPTWSADVHASAILNSTDDATATTPVEERDLKRMAASREHCSIAATPASSPWSTAPRAGARAVPEAVPEASPRSSFHSHAGRRSRQVRGWRSACFRGRLRIVGISAPTQLSSGPTSEAARVVAAQRARGTGEVQPPSGCLLKPHSSRPRRFGNSASSGNGYASATTRARSAICSPIASQVMPST